MAFTTVYDIDNQTFDSTNKMSNKYFRDSFGNLSGFSGTLNFLWSIKYNRMKQYDISIESERRKDIQQFQDEIAQIENNRFRGDLEGFIERGHELQTYLGAPNLKSLWGLLEVKETTKECGKTIAFYKIDDIDLSKYAFFFPRGECICDEGSVAEMRRGSMTVLDHNDFSGILKVGKAYDKFRNPEAANVAVRNKGEFLDAFNEAGCKSKIYKKMVDKVYRGK